MTLLSIRLYAGITAILGIVQVLYNALWIGAPAPPFGVPDLVIAIELGWALVSIDFTVRLRRRLLPYVVPLSYVIYTALSLGYSSFLASTSGDGTVSEAMIPLWWKVIAIAVGAWYIAGALMMITRIRERLEDIDQ